jgi:hypothetical protein
MLLFFLKRKSSLNSFSMSDGMVPRRLVMSIYTDVWLGAEMETQDEYILEQERLEAEERARKEEEERKLALRREKEAAERAEQERVAREEKERKEQEKKAKGGGSVRGGSTSGVRGVRGTRASMRGAAAARGSARGGSRSCPPF